MKMDFLFVIMYFLSTACYKGKKDVPVIAPPDTAGTGVQITYKEKAKQVYDNIVRFYGIPGSDLFHENYPAQAGDPQTAYFWPHTGVFTAAMLLKSLGYEDPSFQRATDGMEEYWDEGRLPVGYQSAPMKFGNSDRFYDDNATAGLDLVRAFEITGQQQFLDRAEACLRFDMSGESNDQGGGLFWCEQYRTNAPDNPNTMKAANATAFAATLALKLYQLKGNQEYLDFAKRMYNWNKTHMQDPADKIYWNSVSLNGVVNKTKWAYNTGEMLTASCLLYQITKDAGYLEEAKALARASYNYFTHPVGDKGLFFPDHDPWFTAILFRGYLDLYALDKNDTYINTVIKNVDYAWENARNGNGFFYEDWSGKKTGRDYWILNQTCMVEIYARISKFRNE